MGVFISSNPRWFGKRLGLPYRPNPEINKNTEITIEIKGNELSWCKKFITQKIIKKQNGQKTIFGINFTKKYEL